MLEQLLKHSESEQGRALISDSDAEAYATKLEVLHLLKSLDLTLRAPLAPQAGGEVGTAPPAPPGSEREAVSRRIPFHDLVKSPRSTLDAVVTPSNVHKVSRRGGCFGCSAVFNAKTPPSLAPTMAPPSPPSPTLAHPHHPRPPSPTLAHPIAGLSALPTARAAPW